MPPPVVAGRLGRHAIVVTPEEIRVFLKVREAPSVEPGRWNERTDELPRSRSMSSILCTPTSSRYARSLSFFFMIACFL